MNRCIDIYVHVFSILIIKMEPLFIYNTIYLFISHSILICMCNVSSSQFDIETLQAFKSMFFIEHHDLLTPSSTKQNQNNYKHAAREIEQWNKTKSEWVCLCVSEWIRSKFMILKINQFDVVESNAKDRCIHISILLKNCIFLNSYSLFCTS